ncbi:cysteine desulfurase [Yersinia pseudotuberculosis]|nr:cysteine desulfurase [Yersinia pseudotuberculosis]CNI40350.1 cysteine desulfurase [Yersinia pseudotuberculosis]CNI94868.1 cysteine desulfurase [Yersinia pseudotuberculosis]VEE73483.1 cysteine desulfurase [Yersinia pseudotuberculosis]
MIRTKINSGGLDVDFIRDQFPILKKQINGHPLVYLDNASTCQKPQAVIDAITKCYCEYYANAHRGVHTLSQCATTAFEHVREQVRDFLHARSTDEVIFTRGTTEAINLVATSWGKSYLHEGDEVLISALEHHSNLVPWQQICRVTGARLKVLPIEPSGVLQIDSLEHLLSNRTRVLALSHVSNVLGTINPLAAIIQKVRIYDQMQQGKKEKTIVLIDGAQAVPHISINVQELDADFYAFSGHKLYGPSGMVVMTFCGKCSLGNTEVVWWQMLALSSRLLWFLHAALRQVLQILLALLGWEPQLHGYKIWVLVSSPSMNKYY